MQTPLSFKKNLFGETGLIESAGGIPPGSYLFRTEKKGFSICKNLNEFKQIYESSTSGLHEVILENTPRKLVFDIDFAIPNIKYTDPQTAYTSAYDGLLTYISEAEKNNNINKLLYLPPTSEDLISLNHELEDIILYRLHKAIKRAFRGIPKNYLKDLDDDMLDDSKPYISNSHGFDKIEDESLKDGEKNVKYKFSAHIVYPIVLSNYLEQKKLANDVIDNLPTSLQSIFDRAIYKKTFMLRLINSSKSDSIRVKLPSTGNSQYSERIGCNLADYIVSDIDFSYMMVWPTSILRTAKIYKINNSGEIYVNTDRIYNVNSSYIERFRNLSYRGGSEAVDLTDEEKQAVLNNTDGVVLTTYNGSIRLHRNHSGYCKICSKRHDTDHGYVVKNPGGVFIGCYRSIQYHNKYKLLPVITYRSDNNNKVDNIEDELLCSLSNDGNSGLSDVSSNDGDVSSNDSNTCRNNQNNVIELNCKYLDSSIYSDNLKDNDILFVKSGTGSGKSASLRKYLEELIETTKDKELRVLMISYRRSLSVEQYRNYQSLGFKHYDIDKQELHGNLCSANRLIIQVESLYKLQSYNYKPYDLLILDEVNKTVEQLNSGLCRNPHGNKAILYSILKTQKIIGIDAFLNSNSLKCIAQFRKEVTDRHTSINDLEYKLINNTYKHKSERVYYNVTNKYSLIQNIIASTDSNKKIFIASNSRIFAEEVYHILDKHYNKSTDSGSNSSGNNSKSNIGRNDNPNSGSNNKTIKIYHGQSDSKSKDELFNVNDNWKVDILIYTSVIEAGNSFDEEWFDVGFLYFTNKSTNHLGCLQMTDRVRCLSSNTCYFHINERSHYYRNTADIEEQLNVASYAADQNIHNSWVLYSKYRESDQEIVKFRKDEAYYTFIRNIEFDNYSKANFRKLMLHCWSSTGIKILDYLVDDIEGNATKETEIKRMVLDTKIALKDEKIESIVKANINVTNVPDSELDESAKIKLQLVKVYNIPETKIDKSFITKYNKVPLLRGYNTRKKIIKFGNIEKYKANLVSKYNDLNSEYTSIEKKYKQSNYIDKMLSLDVLEILTDGKSLDIIKEPKTKLTVEKAVLELRINKVIQNISGTANSCKYKTKLVNAKPDYRIRVINEILSAAVDVRIRRTCSNKNNKNQYYNISVYGFIS